MVASGTAAALGGAGQPIDVFISYAREDVALAERLEQVLTARSKRVWRDKTRLRPGERVTNVIPEALREAKAVVTIWSDAGAASDWVKHETSYAEVADKLATLSTAGFDYAKLSSVYRDLHCDGIDIALSDPTKLLRRIEYLADPARTRRARIDISRLPTTYAKRLYGREKEMADLAKAWDSAGAEKTNVVVIDAFGGVGKTALVNHFVHGLGAQGWRGAEGVFVWSFYSQGTDDKRQASADDFFKTALAWFGHTGEAPGSPHEKGVRLAELVATRRTLLVLDGLEPLQYGEARRAGGSGDAGLAGNLKDQGLRALLRQMAAGNPGLVIVTTRLAVPELAGRPGSAVLDEQLGPIPTPAGVELLRDIGVKGPDKELAAVVEELAGHAIALTQVATWLVKFRGGDVRCQDELPPLVDLGTAKERHPYRVMLAYERQFKREINARLEAGDKLADIEAGRQLALLFLMGLFDRPMERGDREALLAEPVIPGLTDGLIGLGRHRIDETVESLRSLGLLLPWDKDAPHDIDAHPLVREYFGARLEKAQPHAWQAAHRRLYDHYRFRGLPEAFREPVAYGLVALQAGYREHFEMLWKGLLSSSLADGYRVQLPPSVATAEVSQLQAASALIDGPSWNAALVAFLPETEERMAPLFAAIAHGCAADIHDEAFLEVYNPRIARGNEKFSAKKLGLFGSDLAAIAHFFAEPFTVPAPGLSHRRQSLVLNLAGAYLGALGRLAEAVAPMRAGIKWSADEEDWRGAADDASNLSELLVTLGRLRDNAANDESGAVATAVQAVAYADKSRDEFTRMAKRTGHADALVQAGAWGEAVAHFADAEAMQREQQPRLPLLYSMWGFRWCVLKLAQGRATEVATRASLTLKWGGQHLSLLSRANDTLSLGRAAHLAGHASAILQLDAAVDGLRASGNTNDLPGGLLARAAYHRDSGNDKLASNDLTEAFEISKRGGMQLFLADCWLESARQQLAKPNPSEVLLRSAAEAVVRAETIVAEAGYHRRDPDLAILRAELALRLGDAAAARSNLDAVIAAMRAHDLWSFLPQVVRLAERHGLTDLAPTIADLHAARAHFDAEADAAFEEARKVRRTDGLDDDVIDARLADPEFRARLSATLVASGYKPLGETPIEEQRNDARQYILQVERKQGTDTEPEKPGIDPSSIPDTLVDQMLADARFLETLEDMLTKSGMPKLANLDADGRRAAARAAIAAIAQAREDAGSDQANVATAPLPSELSPPAPSPAPLVQPRPSRPERRGGILGRLFGPFMRRDT